MGLPRMSVVAAVFAALAALTLPVRAPAAAGQADLQAEVEAARAVMDQLAEADRPLAMSEIDELDALGPMPWVSLTSRRSPHAMAAWRAIAAQLPASELGSVVGDPGLTFTESEAPTETGGNDTVETGDRIDGFGTGSGDERVVTIEGALQGAVIRPPIEGDCESSEDDGSIGSANPTPASVIQVALCVGEIGDGPFGETSGDFDFYEYGEVPEGTVLILDTAHISGSLAPADTVIGIYDSAGNLLASMEDSGDPNVPEFLEVIAPATGTYYGVVGGCCDLQTDPNDSSSGPGVGDIGTYEVFVVAFPPPCVSTEDDGAIDLANGTAVADRQFDFCAGVIGDGPSGPADSDFYALGVVEEGEIVLVDVLVFEGSVQTVLGIYDADGTLLASGEDDGDLESGELLEYVAETTGALFVAVSGCCELPSDPFDSSSGTPSDQEGLYEVLFDVFPAPCGSAEDDGSIVQANATLVGEQGGDVCFGVIGDGPFGSSDTDFYQLGFAPEGNQLSVDLIADEPLRGVVGIYDADGNLLVSGEDEGSGEEGPLQLEVTTAGEYVVGLAGCCDLPSDPNDSSSGSPSEESGPYVLFMTNGPPPCESSEDDGSIGSANPAIGMESGPDIFEVACFGFVGDGPQAEANGDVDMFRTRSIDEGRLLIVDFFSAGGPSDAGDLTIGIYNDAGELIGSGQDDPGQAGPTSDFFSVTVPATGQYTVAIAGGLPEDPNDPTTGTNTDIVSDYAAFVVDTTEAAIGGGTGWGARVVGDEPLEVSTASPRPDRVGPLETLMGELAERRAAAVSTDEGPVIDIDFFLVDLDEGDAISGGFDASRVTGIIDPSGVVRSETSGFNPSFIYPADSPLRHPRRNGFDHVVTETGTHAVFVTEGAGPYQGELRVARAGRGDVSGDDQQIIWLDFDGATVPADVFGSPEDAVLSPLAGFLALWGLSPADEDAVIDATIDAVVETLDTDLRVLDGRNGDRDASGTPGEFDVEVLNSRDHGDRWGDPDVTRIIVGGTIPELQIPTIGLAQSIDPGNLEPEETGVVLLDIMSEPAGSQASINSYPTADGVSKASFVGFVVGHIAAHEIGHVIGNWHQETFNEVEALMDAGGDFPAIAGVGDDGIFGTPDDTDPDFVEDIFSTVEGFVGIEDTAGRSVFGLSTGLGGPTGGGISDLTIEVDGVAYPGEPVDVFAEFTGGTAPFTTVVDWGDGTSCPGTGTCLVDPMEDQMPGLVDADHTYAEAGVFTITVTVTDANGSTISGSVDTATCTIIGTDRAETLRGTPEDDVICGLGGNDRLFGEGGNDVIFGGTGRDRIEGGPGEDTLFGGREPDNLGGGDDADAMSGGTGNDIMRGGDGDDVMNGRLGGDRMFGEDGVDTMIGNRGDDRMYGGADGDVADGRRGSDIVHGQDGDDDLSGGQGRDELNGGRGNDDLAGGSGADNLLGGIGDDDLDGGDGDDRCIGGPGLNAVANCER